MALSRTTRVKRLAAACTFGGLTILAGCSSDGVDGPAEDAPDVDFSEQQQELEEVQQELDEVQQELLEEQAELSDQLDDLESEIDIDINIEVD